MEEAKSKGQQYITKTLDELELNYFHLQGQFNKTMAGRKMSLNTVLQMMQHDATLWNDLLHISGGKLELHKCLNYLMTWKWNTKGATLIPADKIKAKILLTDDHHTEPIQHYNCNKAHQTLGQFKASNGDQSSLKRIDHGATHKHHTTINRARDN